MLALLLGCTGTVSFDGLEPMSVASATWLEIVDEGDDHAHHLVLSNRADWCGKFEAGSRLAAALASDVESGATSECDWQDRLVAISAAFDDIVTEGARELDFVLPGAPEVAAYRTPDADGDDPGPVFEGWYVEHRLDWYAEVAAKGDCDDPDGVATVVEEQDMEVAGEIDAGTLDVSAAGATVSATADGTLLATGGDPDDRATLGSFTASGTFAHCEVTGFESLWWTSSRGLTQGQ